ncbi:MAG: hypothetical protein AB1Z67_11750 [Candidatus Limnocylindrales bacterium]
MTGGRGLLLVALVPGLLAMGGLAVAAQEPTGPTVVVAAPDDPTVRAALIFPAGWRLEAATDEAPRRNINALAIDERCEVGTRRSDFGDLDTDLDDFEVTLAPGSGYIFIGREAVELPAGRAERIDFAANEEGGRWSVYAIWDAGYVHELWCRGDELPQDRWLPVARTLDLDPDPGLASSPFEPVVARPDAGVAMAFGEEWNVRGSSTNQGLLYATSPTAVCALSDYSTVAADKGWSDVDAMHDEYVAVAEGRDDLTVAESSYLELPAGRTGFAEIGFDDGTQAIRYSFSDGEGRLLALFCVGDPTPEDRYLALAETVEWRPGR